MGKDKKKKKENKGKGIKKTELKTERNLQKKARKLQGEDEEDIEVLIAKFKKMDEEKVAITEEVCSKPSPRVHASLVVYPNRNNELILFGGELFDGEQTYVYNDLFRYNIQKKEWRKISSPNSPTPRCSHQAAIYKNWMYIFGGEFASPSQNQFYHYKDLWRLNLDTWAWENLKDVKGGPSGRSGHRMVVWKNFLFVFGGFYDAFTETKYFNDLHMLDLTTHKWKAITFPPTQILPPPRSGFIMAIHENYLFIYGGYSKDKANKYAEPKGVVHKDTWCLNLSNSNPSFEKIKKSGILPTPRSGISFAIDKKRIIVFGGVFDEETEDELKSEFYNDLYAFHMNSRRWFKLDIKKKKDPKDKKERKKEKLKKGKENITQKEKDIEEEEEEGEENYASDEDKVERNEEEYGNSEITDEEEEEVSKSPNFQSQYKKGNKEKLETSNKPTSKEETSNIVEESNKHVEQETKSEKIEETKENISLPLEQPNLPSPRMNSLMVIIGNALYLFGGAFEDLKNREITYNDMYSLNLHKMDGFECIQESDIVKFIEEESDEEEDEEEEDEDEELIEDEEMEEEKVPSKDESQVKEEDQKLNEENEKQITEEVDKEDEEQENEESEENEENEESNKLKDNKNAQVKKSKKKRKPIEELKERLQQFQKEGTPTPEPNESLKDFYARTNEFWAKLAFQDLQKPDEKELRREGFSKAEKRYNQLKPLMDKFAELIKEAEEEKKQKEKEKKEKREREVIKEVKLVF